MKLLSPDRTQNLLKRFKIPVTRQVLAKNPTQAVAAAKKLGFPVVMKISSPDIVHKTESKGVLVGIKTVEEVIKGYATLVKRARAYKRSATISGILMQEQIAGQEVIIGSKHDPTFGPVIMFGLGGVFVEVLKDVAFRKIPVERKDVQKMIQDIKGLPLLEGIRGAKPVNFRALEDAILGVSRLIDKNPQIQELDINPLLANQDGVWAADVRILV